MATVTQKSQSSSTTSSGSSTSNPFSDINFQDPIWTQELFSDDENDMYSGARVSGFGGDLSPSDSLHNLRNGSSGFDNSNSNFNTQFNGSINTNSSGNGNGEMADPLSGTTMGSLRATTAQSIKDAQDQQRLVDMTTSNANREQPGNINDQTTPKENMIESGFEGDPLMDAGHGLWTPITTSAGSLGNEGTLNKKMGGNAQTNGMWRETPASPAGSPSFNPVPGNFPTQAKPLPLQSESPAFKSLGEDFSRSPTTGGIRAGEDLTRLIPALGVSGSPKFDPTRAMASVHHPQGPPRPGQLVAQAQAQQAQQAQQAHQHSLFHPAHHHAQPSQPQQAGGPSRLGRHYLSQNDPQHISKHPQGSISFPGIQHPVIPHMSPVRRPNEASPTLSLASDETFTLEPPTMNNAAAVLSRANSSRRSANTSEPQHAVERPNLRQNTADSFASTISTSSEEEDITSPMVLPETSLGRTGTYGSPPPTHLFPKLLSTKNVSLPGGQAQFTYTPRGGAPIFPPMSSSSEDDTDEEDESSDPQDGGEGAKRAGSITVGYDGYKDYDPAYQLEKPSALKPEKSGGGGDDGDDDDDGEDDDQRRKKGPAGHYEDAADGSGSEDGDGQKKRKPGSKEVKTPKRRKAENPEGEGDVICDYREPLPPHEPCTSRFHRTYDLARHRETIHARNEGRAVAAGTLPEHLATVWLEYGRPQCAWPCEYPGCDQVFSRKDAMQRHMKTRKHDGVLPAPA